MHQRSLQERAISLRQQGFSYSYIALHTGLSKSTLSGWLATIPYKPNQYTVDTIGKARAASGAKKAVLKQHSIAAARTLAKKELGDFSERDLFVFGLGLYMGEGSKTHDIVRITNADPSVIRTAIAWFTLLGAQKQNMTLTLHVYPDSDIEACLRFWSKETTIPMGQFKKISVDMRRNKQAQNKGKLPYGTAHLGIKCLGDSQLGVFLSRRIQALNELIAERAKAQIVRA